MATVQAQGYSFLYLSSRSIGQASLTRDYLQRLHVDGHQLPLGPVVISPDGLVPSLYREMVVKRPHEFKIRCAAATSAQPCSCIMHLGTTYKVQRKLSTLQNDDL